MKFLMANMAKVGAQPKLHYTSNEGYFIYSLIFIPYGGACFGITCTLIAVKKPSYECLVCSLPNDT